MKCYKSVGSKHYLQVGGKGFLLRVCRYLYQHQQYWHIGTIFFNIGISAIGKHLKCRGNQQYRRIGISAKMSYRHTLSFCADLGSYSSQTWSILTICSRMIVIVKIVLMCFAWILIGCSMMVQSIYSMIIR